jgi:feruloyl esterase
LRTIGLVALLAFASAVPSFAQSPDRTQACGALANFKADHIQVTEATVVAAGALQMPELKADDLLHALPAFCRVIALSRPTSDSEIPIEVWLPIDHWNGKFMGVGNGGFAGSIGYQSLAGAVLSGFASGATDTGHKGSATEADWALGHPEKIVDFGYRAVHETAVFSQAVVTAFYASAATHTYFSSCSDGGREALMEAQRFPQDYEGILAGAPAYNWVNLISRAADLGKRILSVPANNLPAAKIPALASAVLAACHTHEPGPFLQDARACHFNPETLLCKGADSNACFTQAQINSIKAIYAASKFADGREEYPGFVPGGELGQNGWQGWIATPDDGHSEGSKYATGFFRDMVFSDADWQLASYDLDRDFKIAEAKVGPMLDATNPDLSAFEKRGGKLILYHGWNDPAISAFGTIEYVQQVEKTMGPGEARKFVRLFLVPGMQHCGGGPGPVDFGQFGFGPQPELNDAAHNITAALMGWVEGGQAPEQVVSRGIVDGPGDAKDRIFSQPICAYPKEARYSGKGDRRLAASYTCAGGRP